MKKGRRILLLVVLSLAALLAGVWFLAPGVTLRLAQRSELRAAGLEQRGIDAAGHHIEYLAGGSGDAIVLLHGFAGDKSHWVHVARYLTPHLRVIAPDLPGFGESTRDPRARYAIADQVERLHGFVQALGVDAPGVAGKA